MMKNYIQQIIELFGHNEYSLATRRKVQRWLADDNHAEEKKEALHTLWQQAGEQKVPRGMQQSILRMQQNLGMQSVGSGKKYQLLIWRAAAIFLLAVSSVSIYLMLEKDKPQKDLVECFIPTAEIRELTLPDGTRVMLNSRSTLLYPEQFAGKTRSVYLIGEANFQVKPDVILKPNEQITYNKQTRKRSLQSPRIEDVTAWQRGELVFSDMHLDEIFTSLERKFPYTFVYSLHSLNNKSYSFRFQQRATLEEVMKIITQVAGDVKYIIKGNKCYITDKI